MWGAWTRTAFLSLLHGKAQLGCSDRCLFRLAICTPSRIGCRCDISQSCSDVDHGCTCGLRPFGASRSRPRVYLLCMVMLRTRRASIACSNADRSPRCDAGEFVLELSSEAERRRYAGASRCLCDVKTDITFGKLEQATRCHAMPCNSPVPSSSDLPDLVLAISLLGGFQTLSNGDTCEQRAAGREGACARVNPCQTPPTNWFVHATPDPSSCSGRTFACRVQHAALGLSSMPRCVHRMLVADQTASLSPMRMTSRLIRLGDLLRNLRARFRRHFFCTFSCLFGSEAGLGTGLGQDRQPTSGFRLRRADGVSLSRRVHPALLATRDCLAPTTTTTTTETRNKRRWP